MRITSVGTDFIEVNEGNYASESFQKIPRVHLIKLSFTKPTFELVKNILHLYPKTNRFVLDNNIKIYNSILRRTEKKYYVMNRSNIEIISFFRKNNKILLNLMNLTKDERDFFLMEGIFEDILKNTEVIAVNKKIYDEKMEVLDKWKGNIILLDDNQII